MDDIYRINVAKTNFREAYNSGDVGRLLAEFSKEGFTDMSEGGPSKYGEEAITHLREKAEALFSQYSVRLSVIIIAIAAQGDTAYDYGWHEFILRHKSGGEPIRKRQRYFELWRKDAAGSPKITLFISNDDFREELRGTVSRWFMSEEGVVVPDQQ